MIFEYYLVLFVTFLSILADSTVSLVKCTKLYESFSDDRSSVHKRWTWILMSYHRLVVILIGSGMLYFLRGLIRTW